jgi:hypothetical protein
MLTITSGNGQGDVHLVTRSDLDGRTKARRRFDAVARGVADDLGGADRLSTVQLHLVEAFAGAAVMLDDCHARMMAGEDVGDRLAQLTSTLVRVGSRIGLRRVARDVTPTLKEYVESIRDSGPRTAQPRRESGQSGTRFPGAMDFGDER